MRDWRAHARRLACGLALAGSCAVLAEPGGTASAVRPSLTLAEAQQIARQHSPLLRGAEAGLAAARGDGEQAAAWLNPELSLSAENLGNDRLEGGDGPSQTLALSQRLELGGKRAARIAAAHTGQQSAALALQQAGQQLDYQVASAFARSQLAQAQLRLQQQALQQAEQAEAAARQRVRAGSVSPLEAERAALASGSARAELALAQAEAEAELGQLASLLGQPVTTLSADIEGLSRPIAHDPATLDNAPLLRQAKLDVDLRQAELQGAKAAAVPDLTLSAGVRRLQELDEDALLVGVSAPLPLFDRNRGGRSAAGARLEQAQAGELATRQALAQRLSALRARISALETLLSQGDQRPLANRLDGATLKAYQAGKLGLAELLEHQRAARQWQRERLERWLALHLSRFEQAQLLGLPAEHYR